jgi:hypothetical protein
MAPDSEQLEKEREGLRLEIEQAFRSVSRAGGVSWSQTGVLDGYGTEEELAAARKLDTERNWRELVDDPSWEFEVMFGGFGFLDPIGLRYYLAAAMMRQLRDDEVYSVLESHLTLPPDGRAYETSQWALLELPQRHCVARFLRYMVALSEAQDDSIAAEGWRRALRSYWGKLE